VICHTWHNNILIKYKKYDKKQDNKNQIFDSSAVIFNIDIQ